MPVENGKGDARQVGRSATCRAWGAARRWEARGGEAEKRYGPERQAAPAGSGTRWQGARRGVRAWPERLAERERATGPVSFGSLGRGAKHLWQKIRPSYPCDTLDFDRAERRNDTALPAENRRFVDRRHEETTEGLKAHSVIFLAELGDRGILFHGDIGCISCNFWQAEPLHFGITKFTVPLGKVAS